VRGEKPGSRLIPFSPSDEDKGLTAILKWIPVEVIAAYKFIIGLIPADNETFRLWSSLAGIPVSALWIAYATRPEGQRIAWRQAMLAPIAFACWAAAIQGDVLKTIFPHWESWMGSIALGAGMVLLPIFDGILKAVGVPQN
jgi:hypothetical protein